MSKKSKGVISDSTPSRGSSVYEDSKTRMRHQALLQDYQELLKETDDTQSKLEVEKQRKLKLAAEVRFLRRRYQYFVKTKTMDLSAQQKVVQLPHSLRHTKNTSGQLLGRKKASFHSSPPVPEPKSKKRRYMGKEVPQPGASPGLDQHHKKTMPNSSTPNSVLNHEGRIKIRTENFTWNTPLFNLNQKERMHVANDTALRKSIAAFDLNQDSSPSGRQASLPTRTPIFDLNEIS